MNQDQEMISWGDIVEAVNERATEGVAYRVEDIEQCKEDPRLVAYQIFRSTRNDNSLARYIGLAYKKENGELKRHHVDIWHDGYRPRINSVRVRDGQVILTIDGKEEDRIPLNQLTD